MKTQQHPVVTIEEITVRVNDLELPDVEGVVAIERGGLTAGAIVAARLDCPLSRLRIEYRDDSNAPRHPSPRLVGTPELAAPPGARVLVVDDVSVSGVTLTKAAEALGGYSVTTLVLKGKADVVVFPDLAGCVTWPWSPVS